MILSDNETKVDLLNNEAFASTIVALLKERPDHPITVGVHGDWGAGKSSVLEMIESSLEGQDDILCIKFNGWRFQGFEDAKIALIESIVSELIEKRPVLTKAIGTVKNVFQRIDLLKAAKAGGSLFLASQGILIPSQVNAAATALGEIEGNPEKAEELLNQAKSFLKPSDPKNIPQEIKAFREAFDSLLTEAGISQLVVLVDDLDRCLPDVAIETLEAIRLFVFTARTAFVVAADETMIEYAVRKHFPDLPDTTGAQTFARNYLEKLIQVPFRIPPLGELETRIYVTLLLVGAELGEEDKAFTDLIGLARERLKKPWDSTPIDTTALRTTLKDKAGQAQNVLTLADQIGSSLASGTKGNPRQIKRFLNTLVLRQRTAAARGFGSDVQLPVLAKLMLAERFHPRLFDQIAVGAATSTNGICEEFSQLESLAGEGKDQKTNGAKKVAGKKKSSDTIESSTSKEALSHESPMLKELLTSEVLKHWSAINPSLAGVDLRPYLFVSKERTDYFGATAIHGHLALLAEQMFGSKMVVQRLGDELKSLAGQEALQLFEVVRGRIINSSNFDKEPAGVAGLTVLVKNHPELQDNLVDFLEGLHLDNLGPWVVSGWSLVLTKPEVISRLKNIMSVWAKDGKSPLKAAAQGAQKIYGSAN